MQTYWHGVVMYVTDSLRFLLQCANLFLKGQQVKIRATEEFAPDQTKQIWLFQNL